MLKKLYPSLMAMTIISFFAINASAQLTQPYTLNFSSNATTAWADGIAQDGDGGSVNISGLDLQIYAADAVNFNVLPGSTMRWANNTYFSSGESDYTGLTPGPDPDVTFNGFPAMVIKSTNPAFNFSLTNIRLYDWGGFPTTVIRTYNNGVLVGTINVTFQGAPYPTRVLTPATGLSASVFQNIDEIRFTPQGGGNFWLSMNDITVSNLGVLPLKLSSFETLRQPNSSALLKWTTEQEANLSHFEIEHSLNGTDFSFAGKVQATGSHTAVSKYSFSTGLQTEGKHFYRLKIVNADGSFTYSKTSILEITTKEIMSIYPNPVKDITQVYANGEKITQVRVYSVSGSLLKSQKVNALNARIDLSVMPNGTYYIDVVTDKATRRKAVIKN